MTSISVVFNIGNERSIAVENPVREISRVKPIGKHCRAEKHSVDSTVWPTAVRALRLTQPSDAATDGFDVRPNDIDERQKSPACHDSLALRVLHITAIKAAGKMFTP